MQNLDAVLHGFVVALTPENVLFLAVGVLLGTLVGVLPGLGAAAGTALLVPLTFGMEPTTALIMLAGVYYGAMYGGSTTSILINTPGEASTVVTALDGYQMARRGRAGAALAVAAVGSLAAGTIGIILLTVLITPLASLAERFGPPEYFALMIFALTAVMGLVGRSPAKGLMAVALGLIIGTVGLDLQTGVPRYTFGFAPLQEGVDFLVVAIGLFAIGEVLDGLETSYRGREEKIRLVGKVWPTRAEVSRSVKPVARGGVLGFLVGVLPGAGGVTASILSYATERRLSKRRAEFGEGAIEGVAGPEAANNASTSGAMIPLFTLGVPGSSTTAVLLGAMLLYGLQPGPLLLQQQPDLVWGVIDSMYLGNIMLVLLNLPLVGLFARLLYIPKNKLLPLVLVIALVGAYTIRSSMVDVFLALLFGVVGYLFRKVDMPVAPLVLALVLGSAMEQAFRQSLTISNGSLAVFVASPISVVLLVLAAGFVGFSLVKSVRPQ